MQGGCRDYHVMTATLPDSFEHYIRNSNAAVAILSHPVHCVVLVIQLF